VRERLQAMEADPEEMRHASIEGEHRAAGAAE
jgi:hypothetical protein